MDNDECNSLLDKGHGQQKDMDYNLRKFGILILNGMQRRTVTLKDGGDDNSY